MGQFAGTAFGIGTPSIYQAQPNLAGFSPNASQGFGGYGTGPYGIGTVPPIQQLVQMLQIVPQQLHQLQLQQQQQLLHLQQLLQVVPAQLQQLQQLAQVIPYQTPQLQQQQWQPFASGISSPLGFGSVPQPFAGQQTSHVM